MNLLLLLLSLPSAYADDEVSTSLLHLLQSLARTVAVVKSSLHSSKSEFECEWIIIIFKAM